MKRSVAVVLSIALLAPVAGPSLAWAQDNKAEASAHYQRGVQLYREEDYNASLAEFKRAYELLPNWAVLFNIGQSYYQLRDYANALKTLNRYNQEGGTNIPGDTRRTLDTELTELRGRVAQVTVVLNVAGAEVSVDDSVVGTAPFDAPILVSAGRRKFSATAANHQPTTIMVDVPGGEKKEVTLNLAEMAKNTTTTPTTTGPTSPPPSLTPMWISFGVGAAGFIAGGIFGGIALGKKSTVDGVCGSDKAHCPSSQSDNIDQMSTMATVSTVGFVVGAVGAVTGVFYWAITRGGKGDSAAPSTTTPETTSKVRVTPWIGLGSAGLRGSF